MKPTGKFKILIFSYHFLPMDVIASYRAKAIADYLPTDRYETTVLTHYWRKLERDSPEKINNDLLRLHDPEEKKIKDEWIAVLRKMKTLMLLMRGFSETHTYESYRIFRKFLLDHLKMNRYDLIIANFSPAFQLKLAYEVHRKFRIPYIIDFRDMWSNRILHKEYRPSLKEIIEDTLAKAYWKKWLKKAKFFTTISDPIKKKIESLSTTKGHLVLNGFEEELSPNPLFRKFTLTHLGSLYNHQNLELLFTSINTFVNKVGCSMIQVLLIGAERGSTINSLTGYLADIESVTKKFMPSIPVVITKRIPKRMALNVLTKSHILLFPSFPDTPGIVSGKFFDYLATDRPVLMVPDDKSTCANIIRETKAGIICNSQDEIVHALENAYQSFKNENALRRRRNEAVQKYSRKFQIGCLDELIKQNLMKI